MPYGLKLNFKINYDDYNKKIKKGTMLSLKRAIIALAGPITNLIIASIIIIITQCNIPIRILNCTTLDLIYSNLLIALFNLIPIYPMDGGRIIKEILHINWGLIVSYKTIQDITWISISILTAISSILMMYYRNITILIVISYLWILTIRTEKELTTKEKIYKELTNI